MKIYTVMIEVLDRCGYQRVQWVESQFSGRVHLDRSAAERELLEAEAASRTAKNVGDAWIKEEVLEL